ncbi:MAG: uroporphyrinogen-III synthase, partial [Albidovulum sp.]|uniref:uroporphyrinogen-III synthase n=1 Tax=Albidovulum sp. TaxID=1872424 RepID=UPI003CC39688
MDRERPTLLLTRPEKQSKGFAGAFRARFGADWPVIHSPLTAIRYLAAGPVPPDTDGIIFTSQNAVSAFLRVTGDRGLKAWCVGMRTAEVARKAGFDVVAGPGGAEDLAQMIIESGAGRR